MVVHGADDEAGEHAMAINKKDGYGVFKRTNSEEWWFRTYRADDPTYGPYATREAAMEALLTQLGFDVE